jgi:hypothetical protein
LNSHDRLSRIYHWPLWHRRDVGIQRALYGFSEQLSKKRSCLPNSLMW